MKTLVLLLLCCLGWGSGPVVAADDPSYFELRLDERIIKDAIFTAWRNAYQKQATDEIKARLAEHRPYTNRPEVEFSNIYSALSFEQTDVGMKISMDLDVNISFLPFSAGMVMKRVHFEGPVRFTGTLAVKDQFLSVIAPEVNFSKIQLHGLWFLHPSILASIRKSITKQLVKAETKVANELPLEVPVFPDIGIPVDVGSQTVEIAFQKLEYKKAECPAPPSDGRSYATLNSGWVVLRLALLSIKPRHPTPPKPF